MGNIKEAFYKNFTRLVESSDLTQKAIAQKLKVTEPTFYRWKSGDNPPDFETVDRLAEILGVDSSEFYKTHETTVKLIRMSDVAKRIGSVPDRIYELAERLGSDHEVWESIEDILNDEVEYGKNHGKKNQKA